MHTFAAFTAIATFVLLIAGGLVTSTDSGLAVPDWPLSYGTLFPPMVGGIVYEHTHRLIAAAVGLLIITLSVWVHRREGRRWVRRLSLAAAGAVIAQGLLGGLTVVWVLPPPVSIAHACLGQLVFCLVLGVALATSPWWRTAPHLPEASSIRRRCVVLTAAFVGQLVLGAVIRHAGEALPWHLLGAVALPAIAGSIAWRISRWPSSSRSVLGIALGILLGLLAQTLLGILTLWFGQPVLLSTTHVVMGAALLGGSWALTLLVCRAS